MLKEGDILQNRYRIIRELGAGGMGAVYEAEDNQRFGKPVALKEILVNLTNKYSEHFRRAFEREAKILTQIDHEAVPKVIAYILETDYQVLVMELIEGEDLDQILEQQQKPFRLAEVLAWADQLLDALDYLHTLRQPIIHRDIKPQNLKLTSRKKIKLLDFGIAKDTEAELGATKSPLKTLVAASLNYSPIEQIIRFPDYFATLDSIYPEKAKKIVRQASDARSDIYALGATLYHLLANELPNPAHHRALEIWAGRQDSLKPLHLVNPEIPAEISICLHKAMEIEREDRYVSAFEMQAALHDAISYEKHRREEEERKLWLAEQSRIRRDREELEAERRQLAEERRKHYQDDAETERKRQEAREYEAKLKEWKRENSSEKVLREEKPSAATLPSVTQPSIENSSAEKDFDWADLSAEKKVPMDSSSSSLVDFGFENELPKPAAETLQNVKPQTAPNFAAPTNAERKKPIWILPAVAAAVLFIFGISALSIFLLFFNDSGSANKPVTNTRPILQNASPTSSPTPEPSASPSILPTTSPAQNFSNTEKLKPTLTPTTGRTTKQNPVKTPAVQKTQKPETQPTKNSECILTGDC